MKQKKTWICIEHGEEFTVQAHTLEEAREMAAIYGGEVIGEEEG